MFKNKHVQLAIIAIFISIFSYNIVNACMLYDPRILVKCSNLEEEIDSSNATMEGETYTDAKKRWANESFTNLQAVIPSCSEDLNPVLDAFEQEIIKWVDYKNKRGRMLDGDLILEPYSTDKELELQKNEKDLLSCEYAEFKRVDNWLIISRISRPYCSVWVPPRKVCPEIVFSLGHFVLFLATTFNLTTLPYQAGLTLAGAITACAWWMVLTNRPVLSWRKIIALSIIICVLELYITTIMPFWVLEIIGLILVIYILVVWYKQIQFVLKQKAD